jgi:hypothetical protein
MDSPILHLLVCEDIFVCVWISHMDSPILHFLSVRTYLCAYGSHSWIPPQCAFNVRVDFTTGFPHLAFLACEDVFACVWISHMDSPILHCSSVKTSLCMRVV